MDEALVANIIGDSYSRLGSDALRTRTSRRNELLRHRKLPSEGWSEAEVVSLLEEAAAMDANAWHGVAGGGEREGRLLCPFLREGPGRAAGVGRSGDVAALQPKAPGSSLLARVTDALALDAIRLAGIRSASAALVLPVATGMSLLLCLLALRQRRPKASKVLWSRVDQKTALKAVQAAALQPIVVETRLDGDALVTDVEAFRKAVADAGPESILAIVSTTSAFAPRHPDDIEALAALALDNDVPHIVNNAYGLQASKLTHLIEQAGRHGRVDLFLQSTDKNFAIPVGGAIVSGFDKETVTNVSKIYAGRASSTPSRDLLMTLLWLGSSGIQRVYAQRKEVFAALKKGLSSLASEIGERLLETPANPISLALTLNTFTPDEVRQLGSGLFSRRVTGTRVFARKEAGEVTKVAGEDFLGWGSHNSAYPHSYLNVAAAIGMSMEEVELILSRLRKLVKEIRKASTSTSNHSSA